MSVEEQGQAVPARFQPGDAVVVGRHAAPGHIRVPRYVQGHSGVIERLCGAFPNPEELAYGRPGLPSQPLYRVRFKQADLWPDYTGPANDTVEVEIYQHWLTEAGDAR